MPRGTKKSRVPHAGWDRSAAGNAPVDLTFLAMRALTGTPADAGPSPRSGWKPEGSPLSSVVPKSWRTPRPMPRLLSLPARPSAGPATLVATLLLLLVSTTACQYDRESRLAEIRALQAAGQFDESIAPLRVLLTADADHPEANYRLGVALVQTGRPSLAIWPLQKAAQSDEFAIQAGLLLASTLLATDSYEEAIRATDQVLSIDPDRVAALYTRARANISAGQPEQALADAEHVLELKPDDFMGTTLKVAALIDLERYDEAEAAHLALKRASEEAGDEDTAGRACTVLARFYASRNDLDKATDTIVGCLEQHPDHAMVQQYAADFFSETDRPEKAIQVWKDAVERSPEDIGLRAKLGATLQAAGRADEAEALYKETVELFDTSQAWQMLAVFYRNADRITEAREAVEKALERSRKEPPQLRFALADLLVTEGELQRAEEIAASMQEPSYRALIRGSIKLAEGDPARALELLESGLRLWPNNPGARYVAGQAALQLGDLQRALAEYREATRIEPEATDAALAMARIYYSLGKYTAALQFADRHIASRPFVNEDAHVIAIRAAAEEGDWDKAQRLLRNLNTHEEMRNVVVVEHAGVERKRQGDNGAQAAIQVVENSGLDLTDDANAMALTSLTLDLISLGKADEALSRVDKALAKHPDSPKLLDIRARLLARMGRDEEALAAVDKALAADPDFAPALEVKAVYAAQNGRLEEAIDLYDKAAKNDVENADYAYNAASLALRLGRQDEGIERLRKVVSLAPGHVAAVNDLAWRLADAGRELDLALDLAKRATQLDRQAETLDTLGFVQLKRGEAKEAVESFQASLSEHPDEPSVLYRLAVAQSQAGNADAARENLAKALGEGSFPEQQAAQAELARLESN